MNHQLWSTLMIRQKRFSSPMLRTGVRATAVGAVGLVVGVTLFGCGPDDASSQPDSDRVVILVDTADMCSGCEIAVRHVATYGGVESTRDVVPLPQSKTDGFGRILAVADPPHEIVRFSTDGAEDAVIGRAGQGPGEYRGIHNLFVGLADSIFVIDSGLSRVSVLSPDGEYIRSFSLSMELAYASSHVRMPGGDLVLGGIIASPERIGYPLHRVSPEGEVLLSFGAQEPAFDPQDEAAVHRVFDFDGGMIWAARRYQYLIEGWDPKTGELRRVLDRGASWFPPREHIRGGREPGDRPDPLIMGLAVDAERRLWVLVRVYTDDWPPEAGQHGGDVSVTFIEVIDLVTGRLVARTEFGEALTDLDGSLAAHSVRAHEDGLPVMDAWRVELIRAPDVLTNERAQVTNYQPTR